MLNWLSGYVNWYAKRNRPVGHLCQGRRLKAITPDEIIAEAAAYHGVALEE